MNRRQFIRSLGAGAASLSVSDKITRAASSFPQVCLTMDDPKIENTPRLSAEEINRSILDALRSRSNLKAALFVCGRRVASEAGKGLLNAWDAEGHIIANHSYSHQYYNSSKSVF